jgi:hypothetical protein
MAATPSVNSQLSETRELRKEVEQLRGEVEALKKAAKDTKTSLDWIAPDVLQNLNDIGTLKHTSVELDPAAPDKYAGVESGAGLLLVSLGKVEPYLDGYRVELKIANPYLMTFKGVDVSVTWAPRWKVNIDQFAEWIKKNRSQKFSFTDELVPGRWNSLSLILPSTKPDEFGYLSVSLDTNTISMRASLSK